MPSVGEILKVLSAATLGLSVGVMLTGSVVMVPFWRASEPAAFLSWFQDNARSLAVLAGALQLGGLVLATAAAVSSIAAGSSAQERALTLGAAFFALAVLAQYFLYFQGANASFAAASIQVQDVPAELARWAFWQWVRTGFGITAFVLSLLALRYTR
jgi:hypothetical protein